MCEGSFVPARLCRFSIDEQGVDAVSRKKWDFSKEVFGFVATKISVSTKLQSTAHETDKTALGMCALTMEEPVSRNRMGQVTVPSRTLPEEQPEHLTLTKLYI